MSAFNRNYYIRSEVSQGNGFLVNLLKGLVLLILVVMWLWGCLALYFLVPSGNWQKLLLTSLFALGLPLGFIVSRTFCRGTFFCLVLFTILIFWWNSFQPTNDKDWAPDVARISHGEILDNRLVMKNVRNFSYTSEQDFTEIWETREYDLEKFQGLDLFLSYWGSDHIAHTLLSWDFGDDNHLAISIETRKDKSQEYSAIQGFFKQYELAYVAADEKDIIRLRTNYRKERVYLYRLNVERKRALQLLKSYLVEMNRLVDEPEFYNAFTRNCTTTIHLHNRAIAAENEHSFVDWRLIASGHLDELLYERGIVESSQSFIDLRQSRRIDERARNYGMEDFSRRVRVQSELLSTSP